MNDEGGIEDSGTYGIVLVSCPAGESAAKLAGALLERRLAACVQILPGVRSLYRWKGTIHEDAEVLLLAKTLRARLSAIAETVRAMHPYELPELVYLPISAGSSAYFRWLDAEVSARPDPASPASDE